MAGFLSKRWSLALLSGAMMMPTTADAGTIPVATWRGNGAVMTTTAQQSRIDTGTGVAVIKGPIATDAVGRFKTVGTFEIYAPGPQQADVPPALHKAQISGRITGSTVELTMRVHGEKAPRKFTFVQGRAPKLIQPL